MFNFIFVSFTLILTFELIIINILFAWICFSFTVYTFEVKTSNPNTSVLPLSPSVVSAADSRKHAGCHP